MEHPCGEVRAALIRLCDALCTWERDTGRTSALILREQGGFCYRAASGKPVDAPISDAELCTLEAEAPKG